MQIIHSRNPQEHEFIPTRSSGILASKPAANPGQFTRVNSNPLLISAQKQMLLVEEVKKKKKEIKVGDDIPDWQSVSISLARSLEILSQLFRIWMDGNYEDENKARTPLWEYLKWKESATRNLKMVMGGENREYQNNGLYKICNAFPITGVSGKR